MPDTLEHKHRDTDLPQLCMVLCIMLYQGGHVDRLRCKAQH